MTHENVNLDELKRAWLAMGETLGMNRPENDPKNLDEMKTALDRLRQKYRVFWITSLGMVFVSFMVFSRGMLIDSEWNVWLGVAYSVYFLTAFSMDQWLYSGIGTIDPLRQSVSEVAAKAMFYRKRHLQFIVVLIPMAVALIAFTGYVFSDETYFISGMITGALLGIILGIFQFRRFMAYYRQLSE